MPELIVFTPFKKEEQSLFNLNPIEYDYPESYIPEIKKCSAGYGHTLALSEKGDIYAFGFNIKGQLGTGDRKSRFVPVMI